ncbi:hypothetical protein SOM12_20440 [Flavobacterium sp. CFBP9031]|jgi:hypothetical protein|uniref:hypothetical protein n=1 Tax=Flavobacterium sp. CFBP9031 TaxID=3096538 RepID=UPI002A6A1DF5|nr:hypothetical protein [Flavobacterium sp. CFBP9031]MDY0989813.1 hypothetical protein [Flavobacterium sp. CFBP9031]
MQIISIKWKIIVLLLTININLQAQLKSFKSNQHLVYQVGQTTEIRSLFFNDKIDSPVFSLQYDQTSNFLDCENLDFCYQFGGKTYDLQGRIFNQKNVFVTTASITNIQITNLLPVQGVFSNGKFECKKYKSEVGETGKCIVLLTTNLNNEIDYNKPMKELEKFSSVEIPFLAKGEIIIQIGVEFTGNIYYKIIEFVKAEEVDEELIISEKKLEDIYKSLILNEKLDEDENVSLSPSYCSILGSSLNIDPDVREKTEEFLRDMCTYFDSFGNTNNKDFCSYYNREIERRATFFDKHGILDSLQIKQFKKELEGYKDSNQKENFM